VLRRRDQGEADRVLSLSTPLGKLDAIAKGARKIRSRKAGHIELFSRSQFVIARVTNSWDIVSQAETLSAHAVLRSDLLRGTYARYAIELLDRFFVSDEGGQSLFDLLENTLTRLCEEVDLDLITRFYEQRLLGLAGFRPELFHCVGDHTSGTPLLPGGTLKPEGAYGFDLARGGALCPDCYARASRQSTVSVLSGETLRFLQNCQKLPYSSFRSQVIPASLHQAAELLVRRYISYHLESSIKSLVFLDKLRQETGQIEKRAAHQVQGLNHQGRRSS